MSWFDWVVYYTRIYRGWLLKQIKNCTSYFRRANFFLWQSISTFYKTKFTTSFVFEVLICFLFLWICYMGTSIRDVQFFLVFQTHIPILSTVFLYFITLKSHFYRTDLCSQSGRSSWMFSIRIVLVVGYYFIHTLRILHCKFQSA